MHPSGHDDWVEVISGVLFSSKSEELLRRVRHAAIARKRIQVFKSHVDYRYLGHATPPPTTGPGSKHSRLEMLVRSRDS